jgi:hypothetical protein
VTSQGQVLEGVAAGRVDEHAFMAGLAGASTASIDARTGDPVAAEDYRRLIT